GHDWALMALGYRCCARSKFPWRSYSRVIVVLNFLSANFSVRASREKRSTPLHLPQLILMAGFITCAANAPSVVTVLKEALFTHFRQYCANKLIAPAPRISTWIYFLIALWKMLLRNWICHAAKTR